MDDDMDDATKTDRVRDVLISRPNEFRAGRRTLRLYPVTLGTSLILSARIGALQPDMALLASDPMLEALRLCTEHPQEVAEIVATCTFARRRDILDSRKVRRRGAFLAAQASREDMATLLLLVMAPDGSEEAMRETGLDKERQTQARIARMKQEEGSTETFGGKSLFGSLVVPACELFHCLPHTVIWEIPLAQLRLCLADRVSSVWLSEEERMKLCLPGADTANVEEMSLEDLMSLTRD